MLKFSYYIVPDSLYNARREFPILYTPARTLVFPLSIPVHRTPHPLYIIYFFFPLAYDVFLIEKQESKIDKSAGFSLCFEVISDRNDIFRETKSSFMDKKRRLFSVVLRYTRKQLKHNLLPNPQILAKISEPWLLSDFSQAMKLKTLKIVKPKQLHRD